MNLRNLWKSIVSIFQPTWRIGDAVIAKDKTKWVYTGEGWRKCKENE